MNILFIGNSYTYYNDMPNILEALAKENGKDLSADAVTKGGRKLYANLDAEDEYFAQILSLTQQKPYDVLILQEQSYFPLIDQKNFCHAVAELKKLVNAKRTLLYATWGRKEGCALLEERGWTSESMTNDLYDAYLLASELSGSELCPVGKCFAAITKEHPEVELYNPDLSHPSYAGSCVAAMSFYKKILGEMPVNCASLALDASTLFVIEEAVEGTVR